MNNTICLCVFIKRSNFEFAIIAVYANDLNIIATPKGLKKQKKTVAYLNKELEMKDLGKIKFVLIYYL